MVSVFDLWGKINSGYLEGNRFSLGHYTECLDFLEPIQDIKMQGQYCLVVAVPIPNSTITEQPDGFDWREM